MILPGTGRGTAGAAGGGGGSRPALRPETAIARQLRKEMSFPEVLLWQRLRGAAAGVRFRRQHPIGPYIVDFYCRAAKLIVEVDGQVHDGWQRADHDAVGERFLVENGYQVVRVLAADVLKDADTVAASIAALAVSPLHQPAAGPPPRAGEDL